MPSAWGRCSASASAGWRWPCASRRWPRAIPASQPELIDTLIEMYNRGVVPAIPEQGSVGASGDLAPLAHLALVVMGEGHAFVVKPGHHERPRAAGR